MQEESQYVEIDIWQLLKAFWHRLWIIVIAAVILAVCGYGYAHFYLTPTYVSEAMMYVNNNSIPLSGTQLSISAVDLSTSQDLVDTYIVILKTRTTLNEVIREANLNYSYEQLASMISAGPVNNTRIFWVRVTANDPYEAERIANSIARVLPTKIPDVLSGSSVRVVDYAVASGAPVSPNKTRYAFIGFAIGALLACAGITVEYLLDTQIHDEEYLLANYELPVLAVIPNLYTSGNEEYSYNKYYAYGRKASEKTGNEAGKERRK